MAAINRREFLKISGASAAAALAATPGAGFTQVVSQAAPFSDYKALVCVFMFGGNDSFNMVVPASDAEYNVYAAARQNLAIPQTELLAINPLNPDGVGYGLNPAMGGIQNLFNGGQAALVSNMGPLVEPTSKDQYFNQSVTLPPQLFSHNDQQDQWLSLKGASPSGTGWAGRIADVLQSNVVNQQLATNLSLFGNTLFQSGADTIPYTMGANGPLAFAGFGDSGIFLEQRLAFERVIAADYDSIYERAFAEIQERAVSTADLVNDAISSAPTLNTIFPGSQLGAQLQTVARLIAVRDSLQMERQIFFVATGGFDTHDDQNQNQPGLMGDISASISAFYDATVELGIANSVTTFTQSDFGRTLTSNGDGTDHAWGANHLLVGGAVQGQRMYGTYPLLQINGPDDVGGGRMIPTTSADQYAATLARWFGVDDADLTSVAPNLDNFGQRDLGFML
jgi:uncharacterized protein (DUF1501 family)